MTKGDNMKKILIILIALMMVCSFAYAVSDDETLNSPVQPTPEITKWKITKFAYGEGSFNRFRVAYQSATGKTVESEMVTLKNIPVDAQGNYDETGKVDKTGADRTDYISWLESQTLSCTTAKNCMKKYANKAKTAIKAQECRFNDNQYMNCP